MEAKKKNKTFLLHLQGFRKHRRSKSAATCGLLLNRRARGRPHTFARMPVPEYVFGVGVALNLMDGRGPPHAVDAASGEGVGQGAGGLVGLRHVKLLPG